MSKRLAAALLAVLLAVSTFSTISSADTKGFISGSDVQFRNAPGTDSDVIRFLSKGTEVTILDMSDSDWYQISQGGNTGYVYSQFVKISSAGEGDLQNIRRGVIDGLYIRLRNGPTVQSDIIAEYNTGTELTILDELDGWYRVKIGNLTGWILAQYIVPDEKLAEPDPMSSKSPQSGTSSDTGHNTVSEEINVVSGVNGKTAYIKGTSVRFRKGPSTVEGIIAEYSTGKEIVVTGTAANWTKCLIDGAEGFVFSDFITFDNPVYVGSAGNAGGREIANFALSLNGSKYCWGGQDPATGFDCSGFVYYCFNHFGYGIYRTANDMAKNGTGIIFEDIQPGDILLFTTTAGGSYISHTGIYIGDGKFIHSSSSTTGVIITELSGSYKDRFYGARRVTSE